jgi:type IV pilus assembly protein PilN
MIRINLLSIDRERRKKRMPAFGSAAQRLTIACSVILLLALSFCGWRFWIVSRRSHALDKDIAAAQEETLRLHSVIQQVQQFEQRKAQLQQRVVLIEQLRKSQAGPVHMLDQVSRALPPMLWLTELKQVGADVVIDGKCLTLTGLSDFVANLESSGYFKRSVEIVSTQTEPIPQAPGELVKFSVRAQFVQPGAPAPGGSGGKGAAGGAGKSGSPTAAPGGKAEAPGAKVGG